MQRRWTTLAILIAASVLSFIDRQILSLLVGPIKHDLGLTDLEVSTLQGLAFAVFFAVAALPLGWLADRVNRKLLLAAGVALWSAMTMAGGAAQSFLTLFLSRIGVGVGEATHSPVATSIIGDLFDRKRLPLAMSLFGMGVALGAGAAFLLGGQVIALVTHAPPIDLGFGLMRAWQLALLAVGAPGLLLAAVVALVAKEPARSRLSDHSAAEQASARLWPFARRRALVGFIVLLGIGCLTASAYAGLFWLPSFLGRVFHWDAVRAGTVLGLFLLIFTLPGGVLFGWLASRFSERGSENAALKTLAITALISAPLMAAGYLDQAETGSLVLLGVSMIFGSTVTGLGPATVQAVTPAPLRGRISAFQFMSTGLFGQLAGPVGVGLMNSVVFHDETRIGLSLAIVAGGFALIGSLLLFAAIGPYRQAVAEARTWTLAEPH